MSYANLSYEDISKLGEGDDQVRDRAAREMAAMIARNLRTLLEEMDEVMAAGAPMGHVSALWLDPMHKAQHCLESAVSQAARRAGLVAAK